MPKFMTILGTRPEIVRLSRIIPLFDQMFEHILVHTGQNPQHALRDVFFTDLRLRAPDYAFSLPSQQPGATLAALFVEVERAILEQRPDAVLILGDTHSALSCLIANRHGVPVYHMEAGNRCFDRESPEEANRRVVDHSSDMNLVYTEAARRNLLREGLHPRRIHLTGSPLAEVIADERPGIDSSDVLVRTGLEPRGYLLASLHRAENIDHPARLAELVAGLALLARQTGLPILLSRHPRLQDRLRRAEIALPDSIRPAEPFGFHDWCRLQCDAACVLSDSGTVPEEAAILGFPAVTPRRSMERPEALECGNVVLCGTDAQAMAEAALLAMRLPPPSQMPGEYAVPDVARRVAAVMAGTHHLVRQWN
jgi:UDP-N-acetylglucosamine 2-epimerase (non-hydrolysing)